MKFKIFEIDYPKVLHENVADGYYRKDINRGTLKNDKFKYDSFNSQEEAEEHLRSLSAQDKMDLAGDELVILPIIEFDYNGDER